MVKDNSMDVKGIIERLERSPAGTLLSRNVECGNDRDYGKTGRLCQCHYASNPVVSAAVRVAFPSACQASPGFGGPPWAQGRRPFPPIPRALELSLPTASRGLGAPPLWLTPRATHYPVFTLLALLALSLLPCLSMAPAHSVNLLSSLPGPAWALCFTVCRLADPGPGAVLAAVFAVSRPSWQWSVVAEVFSLNLFVGIFSLTASFHCANSAPQRSKVAHWGALCCGLGLCNQHTLVLYVVVIIPRVMLHLCSHRELSVCGLMSLGLCFLPVSYLDTARWSWGGQTSLSGLLTHLQRTGPRQREPHHDAKPGPTHFHHPRWLMDKHTFKTRERGKHDKHVTLGTAQLTHCMADLSLPVLVLAGLGLFSSWDRMQGVVPWLLTAMLLLYSLFFTWRANLDTSRPLLLVVVERFWLQSDAVVCVLAGLGLSWTHTGLERRLGHGGLWRAGGWLFTIGLLVHMVRSNHRECDQSSNSVVEQFERELLVSVPPDSIILTRGDHPGNSLRYCQGLWPDVRLVDQEMMTYSWYVAKLGQHHPGVHFPGRWWDPVHTEEKDTFSLEQFLSHNTQGAVLACIGLPDRDPSWERSFSHWLLGVCDHLVPAQEPFHPEEWTRHTLHIWTEPHNRGSNEKMWQARMKTAFFLFDLAERIQGEEKTCLFELSYTESQSSHSKQIGLCKEIVERRTGYPPNRDKNLALASERLLQHPALQPVPGQGAHGLPGPRGGVVQTNRTLTAPHTAGMFSTGDVT
ncbi:LOW QUALITY PROTEIN: protein O-mannosyl-transferase TMEM260 [Salvelinus alpinus]